MTWNECCLIGYCGYCTGEQRSRVWSRAKFLWHTLFCRWARWPEGKKLPPTLYERAKAKAAANHNPTERVRRT